ncbi:exocyst complex component Sec10 [Pseudovirgaria hyperparasitica]|uniref:Exocyst complex component Sec10 n=1 Tax=Pseudovirgaria hyperparasitica TaxID=470096 RepID=A0A6A6VU16_9PEZI|nr:exocyst complex component Sec10 [Pseudovirgaria hyperparasitica]KAF2754072.1 exocyst complex component Sec10 [Pseudovirgaria hyperparasitica]
MAPGAADTASIITGTTLTGSIRQKGPIFTLETFSDKDFIVKDFIEALSDAAVPASRRSGPGVAQQAFDPKPLIRTFEHALSRLGGLSEDLEEKENELSGSVRRAEAEHGRIVQTLGSKLDMAVENFNTLDSSLNGNVDDAGGNAALRIGEQLEELNRQSQRAQDAAELIHCWVDVSEKGHLNRLEDKKGKGEGSVQAANMARQLLRISHRLDGDPASQFNGTGVNGSLLRSGAQAKNRTREIIEKFLESLETDLLKQFDGFYRRQDFERMKECAIALRDFSDGSSVKALFVNQHQFFIDRSQLITEEIAGDDEAWASLADPDTEPPGVDPSLQTLIDEVRIVVQEESFIIKRAFPFYDEVLIRFLQRVFQQSIQQRLELVLEKADSVSSLAFLRSLQSARSYAQGLVDDLKAHGLTEHPEPATSQIAATLDQQLEDLFVPPFVGTTYIEREKKNLDELYSSLLFKFTVYHSKRRKAPTTMFSSFSQRGKELLSSARDAYMERLDSAEIPSSQKAMLLRIAGVKEAETEKKEIDVTEEDGALSIPNAKRMLKWLAEGVGRGLELTHGGPETPKDVQALLNLLLVHMGDIYLDTALDAAAEQALAQETSKSLPDYSYFNTLRSAIGVLHLLSTSVQTVLLPLASSSTMIRRDIEKNTLNTTTTLESKISTILHRTIDSALNYITKLLAQQKKNDFRPKDDDAVAVALSSETTTCQAITTFLSKTSLLATSALSGRNLSVFLTELVIGVRSLLLEHFRRFTISLTGGLVLSRDVTKYVDTVRDWPLGDELPPGAEAMHVLVDVANLFVINPDALRERLRSVKGDERGELRGYISKREDAGSVGVQAVLSAL